MRQSMTGFASRSGQGLGRSWVWELRGVNGKGLDLRLRMPDGIDGLEAGVRARCAALLKRGNLQISLKLAADEGDAGVRLDEAQLAAVLAAMHRIEADAMAEGLSLAPSTAAEIVGLRGVLTTEAPEAEPVALAAALLADFDGALTDFVAMRRAEGDALTVVLEGQLAEITTLVDDATKAVADRQPQQAERLREQLARVIGNADGVDPARIAQELAVIAVKSDITEEIDRLRAHIVAARDLLAAEGAVGRKFDFLMQEFNREANTLCSKSGDARLTQTGLALKTVIDQMREQVQNVE
ncbi:YicC/YloC family endoribonuclease [Antarctobacter heliothermus]|uniref:TIGR00255 family protein n=1 Tax=Antarctobacter heliothermus TaxID=74033 RepID=A0A239FMR9_9RHOB|nr:YicC/YloC family endoribonuclease [Antarctobacter heliothermus]SNS57918.1 TIGR00255 family protein [Antarctobacter heliothermus]